MHLGHMYTQVHIGTNRCDGLEHSGKTKHWMWQSTYVNTASLPSLLETPMWSPENKTLAGLNSSTTEPSVWPGVWISSMSWLPSGSCQGPSPSSCTSTSLQVATPLSEASKLQTLLLSSQGTRFRSEHVRFWCLFFDAACMVCQDSQPEHGCLNTMSCICTCVLAQADIGHVTYNTCALLNTCMNMSMCAEHLQISKAIFSLLACLSLTQCLE